MPQKRTLFYWATKETKPLILWWADRSWDLGPFEQIAACPTIEEMLEILVDDDHRVELCVDIRESSASSVVYGSVGLDLEENASKDTPAEALAALLLKVKPWEKK